MRNTEKLIGLVGCSTKGMFAYKFGFIAREEDGSLRIEFRDGSSIPVNIEDLTVLVDKK